MVGRQGEVLSKQEVEHAISYIRNHPEIWEVILTGGDPMALSSRRLRVLMEDLDQIEHVKSIRFHTRVPIAAPNLINADIISLLSAAKTAITVSVHCNHAAEITSEVTDALRSIRRAGAMLVSQSVLLRGVNDNRDALIGLFKALTENGVKPYYLHHPDKAPGTGHFQLSLREGLDLYQSLRGHISGLCIPQYMLDIPGGYGKVAIDSHNVMIKKNHAEIIDRHGVVHIYNNS